MTRMEGLVSFTASASPAISPPPPMGQMIASRSGACSTSSSPMVPAPAITSSPSNPWTYVKPRSAMSVSAWTFASAMSCPCRITRAPSWWQRACLISGACRGITTVTGMPSRDPWKASANAWFPADAAITPLVRWSALSCMSALHAPRSLKEPVCCMYSRLVSTVHPHSAESVRDSRQVVLMTAPSMRRRAATIWEKATGMRRKCTTRRRAPPRLSLAATS